MSHLFRLVAMPLLVCGLTGTTAPSANPVMDTSYVSSGGERVLEQSIVIDATIGTVWDAFTTTAGFRR